MLGAEEGSASSQRSREGHSGQREQKKARKTQPTTGYECSKYRRCGQPFQDQKYLGRIRKQDNPFRGHIEMAKVRTMEVFFRFRTKERDKTKRDNYE